MTKQCTNVAKTKKILADFSGFMNRISSVYSTITGVDKYELFGEANIALIRATNDFNATRSSSFGAYAKYIVVDALNEYVRQNKVIVPIPRYIARANQIINRIKKLIDYNDTIFYGLCTGTIDVYTDEIEEELTLLNKAAERAKTTVASLVERAEFLPTIAEDAASMADEVPDETDEHKKLIASLFVNQIKQNLVGDELVIVDYLMDGLPVSDISKHMKISDNVVRKKIKTIRKKVLKLLND